MNAIPVQRFIYSTLAAYAPLAAIVAGRVYDHVPPKAVIPYVTIGITDIVDQSFKCLVDWLATAQIDVWSRAIGYPEGKQIAALCDEALSLNLYPAMDGFRVGNFRPATQRWLRDPDGITSHGVCEYRVLYGS